MSRLAWPRLASPRRLTDFGARLRASPARHLNLIQTSPCCSHHPGGRHTLTNTPLCMLSTQCSPHRCAWHACHTTSAVHSPSMHSSLLILPSHTHLSRKYHNNASPIPSSLKIPACLHARAYRRLDITSHTAPHCTTPIHRAAPSAHGSLPLGSASSRH